jgi:hypothetical protein
MPRTRLSIAGLMGFVVVVAIGIGGLKAADPIWASSCYTLAFFSLIASVILAIQRRERKRAFWVGFAVAGWPFFYLSMQQITVNGTRPQLLTELLLLKAESLFPVVPLSITPSEPATTSDTPADTSATTTNLLTLPPSIPVPPVIPPVSSFNITGPPSVSAGWMLMYQPPEVYFHQVGNSMATIICAYTGGLFSLFLAGRRERNEANSLPDVSPSSP